MVALGDNIRKARKNMSRAFYLLYDYSDDKYKKIQDKEDVIDNTAGYILAKKTGDMALKGDLIATLYTTDKPEALEPAAELMLSATGFWKQAPEQMPLILDIIE